MNEKHLRLPKQWSRLVRLAVVQTVSLAFCAVTHSRGWAINSPLERVRLKSDLERAVNETKLLRDEIRIKDARMNKVPAPRRPHYSPTERMSILELRSARGWSAAQTARIFLVEAETGILAPHLAVFAAPALAVLLVGCSCPRSLLPACCGIPGLPQAPFVPRNLPHAPRRHRRPWPRSQVHRL